MLHQYIRLPVLTGMVSRGFLKRSQDHGASTIMTGIQTVLLPLTAHTRLNVGVLDALAKSSATKASGDGLAQVQIRLARSSQVQPSDATVGYIHGLRETHPSLFSEASDYVVDFSKQKELATAMEGCDGVVLSMGTTDPIGMDAELKMIDAAKASGSVKDVLKISCAHGYLGDGSSVPVGAQHWHVQQCINDAKFDGSVQIVQPNTMMDTFLHGKLFEMICGRSLSVSVKRGRVAFVHPTDVAEVVAKLLTSSTKNHSGPVEEFVLTGPEALTYQEVAQSLSAGIGEQVTYNYFSLWAIQPSMWIRGERPEAIADEIQTARALEAGAQEAIIPTVQDVLGKPPRTFRQFVEEHHAAWPLRTYK